MRHSSAKIAAMDAIDTTEAESPWAAGLAAFEGRLQPRYTLDQWDNRFQAELGPLLANSTAVLDIGAGARPTVPIADRPFGCVYVGLDASQAELDAAEPGSYDERVVSMAEDPVPGLEDRFDLAVSFMCMEHIPDLGSALDNVRSYMRPGGTLLAQLAGGRSPFALANRLMPSRVKELILGRAQDRPPESVFPARYDRCTYSGLRGMLVAGWSDVTVVPLHNAIGYVERWPVPRAAYVLYEEWAYRSGRHEVAPNYLIRATR